ncbi:MAG: hydantoinase/oxoprolinase family protein, partial [Phycisphaerae bacterium]
ANMEHALSVVSAQQGHDPADFHLVSFGGAGGLHACDLAEALGLAGVLVAADAGLLSACGLMLADIVMDFSAPLPRCPDGIDMHGLRYAYGRLMDRALDAVTREGYDLDDTDCERLIDLRYRGQSYELTVPVESTTERDRLAAPFHALHKQRFGFAAADQPVEAVTARVRATIPTPKLPLHARRALTQAQQSPDRGVTTRALIWFDEELDTVVYRRNRLTPGTDIKGPALLIDDYSTTLLRPGWRAEVTPLGHLLLMR